MIARDQSMMSMRVSREKAAQTSSDGEAVRAWLAQVLDERIDPAAPLEKLLHDGILLCRIVNRIHPDAIQTINGAASTQFLLRDNVNTFLKCCASVLGLRPTVLFDVADLFEARNMKRVFSTIQAVSVCPDARKNGIPPLKFAHRRLPSVNDSKESGEANVVGGHQKIVLSADGPTIVQHIREKITSGDNPRGISALHEAASLAEFVKAIDIIVKDEKEDPNVRDRDGLTPLYYAVEKQVSVCVEKLLQYADPSIHYELKYGQTVLHLAVTLPSAKIVDLLIHADGIDINAQTDKKNTPLLTALIMKQTQHALALIDAGADVKISNTQGNTPLHIAVKINSVDCVRALLLKYADTNVKNNAGETPLSLAHKDGINKQILYFIENPERAWVEGDGKKLLDPKQVEEEGGTESGSDDEGSQKENEKEEEVKVEEALMEAARKGEAGMFIKTYEERKDEVKDINFVIDDWTVLHVAATVGCAPLVKYILGIKGVDVNAKGKKGATPLVCAVDNKHQDCAKLLMEEGHADLNAGAAEGGWNPCLSAAYKGDVDTLKMLIATGQLDVEQVQKEQKDYRAIHFAAASKDNAKELLTTLLDAGADINAVNGNGQTALHIAVFWNNVEAVQLLVDRGADKTIKNKSGRTAEQLAIHYDYVDVMKVFGCEGKRIKNPKKPKMHKADN